MAISRGGEAMGPLSGAVDSYGYNGRNEVVSSRRTLGGSPVRGFDEDFSYDPIGNRVSSTAYDENGTARTSAYSANSLNQYAARTVPGWASVRGLAATNAYIAVNGNEAYRAGDYFFGSDDFDNSTGGGFAELEVSAVVSAETNDFVSVATNRVFVPPASETYAYDADGNQTLVTTGTGVWQVEYNGENRPVRWMCDDRVLHMAYDHQGRRRLYVEIVGGVTNSLHRFTYDDYLCVARNREMDLGKGTGVDGFTWDPTEPVATRPLMSNPSTAPPFLYCHDGNKNVSEIVDVGTGEISAHYEYSAFGKMVLVTSERGSNAAAINPYRLSSEYHDDMSGLVYYNYRHYNPGDGRWIGRDMAEENGGYNVYGFNENSPMLLIDFRGDFPIILPRFVGYACLETLLSWYPGGENDSIANDGFRHCKASCDIKKKCGAYISFLAGYLKEWRDLALGGVEFSVSHIPDGIVSPTMKARIGDALSGGSIRDSEMDFLSNYDGLECADSSSNCEVCCECKNPSN